MIGRPSACKQRATQAELEIDAFMRGLAGQESGNPQAVNADTGAYGKWQILPSNWPKWAKAAGLASDAPENAENQRIVTRHVLVGYFIAFGDWGKVAKAWYGGPRSANRNSEHPEGKYPSINAYSRSVLAKVGPLPCG